MGNAAQPRSVAGPLLQLLLLILPLVFSGFFFVYASLGLVLSDAQHVLWSTEALEVALLVGGLIFGYCLLVLAFVRLRGGSWRHWLAISSYAHGALAVAIVAAIALWR